VERQQQQQQQQQQQHQQQQQQLQLWKKAFHLVYVHQQLQLHQAKKQARLEGLQLLGQP
jgi:hypothetical protein